MSLSNYNSAVKRLSKCLTVEQVYKAESSFDRVYQAGQLTNKELYSLCKIALDRIVAIEGA